MKLKIQRPRHKGAVEPVKKSHSIYEGTIQTFVRRNRVWETSPEVECNLARI
jgi:hypothetical protein